MTAPVLTEDARARFTRGGEYLVPAALPDGQRRLVQITRHRPECPIVMMIELTAEEERDILAAINRRQEVR